MDDFEPIAGDLLKPIEGPHPAGVDARHDPEHESLRAELDKLTSLEKAKISWPTADQLATNVLQNKSKDLLAASYGAAAWMELHGAPGLLRGVAVVGGLLTRFPESAFPLRPRARANAVAWFVDRATSWLTDHDETGLDHERLRTLEQLITQTATAARTVLGNDCPSFTSLERAVGRLALSATTPAVAALRTSEPEEPTTIPAPAPAIPAPEPTAQKPEPASDGGPERSRADAWLGPVPGGAPCGIDLTYDEVFAELQSQIGRLESPTADPPDWKRVREVAETLLTARSKDLFVASYLAAALLELEGLPGLTVGAWLVSDMCERHWDGMWPNLKRMRRRTSAFVWFVARAGTRLGQLPTHVPEPQLAALERAFAALATASQRFGDEAPSLRPLTEFVARAKASLPQQPPVAPLLAPVAAAPAASAPQAPSPAPTPGPEQASPPPRPTAQVALPEAPGEAPAEAAQVVPFLRSLGERLVQTARLLRTANKADPSAYRLLRQGVWLHIDKAPPRDAERRTRIPAPQKRVVDALASLVAAEKWDALLAQAEGSVTASPLWLDLHWYAAKALSGLGAEHDAARQAVERETRALVERLPELADSAFQDGTPLACPEARAWLKPPAATAAHTTSSQPSSPEAAVGLSAEQQQLVAAGTKDGMVAVREVIDAQRSERERFLCRLDLAQGLFTAGRAVQALAVFRGLANDIDAFALERWEPALAARALTAYWSCLRAEGSPQGVVGEEARGLCAKLARLAPEALI